MFIFVFLKSKKMKVANSNLTNSYYLLSKNLSDYAKLELIALLSKSI
jgi:hypothetical protein